MLNHLKKYQRIAVEQNPGLLSQYKAFEASLERIPQARGIADPNLGFGYFLSPIETRVGPQRAKISLTQMFPWFGTLKASGDVAALQAEAQYQIFLEARNKLHYQVAAAYYPLYELDQWIEHERDNAAILNSYKTIATSKFENATGSLVDVLRVDLMLKDAETNLQILHSKRTPLLSSFNRILNREEQSAVEIDTLVLRDFVNIKDSLYQYNPQLKELDKRIEASKKQNLLAQKQGLPKIGLGLDYLIVGDRTDLPSGAAVPQDNGKNAFMPMVSVGIPIFRAKYRAARKESELLQQSLELQKEDRINSLSAAYEVAIFEQDKQLELLKLYQTQIEQTQRVLNLLLSTYSNSGEEFEEALRVQQQLLQYKKMTATALTQYHLTLAKLNYLTAKQ